MISTFLLSILASVVGTCIAFLIIAHVFPLEW